VTSRAAVVYSHKNETIDVITSKKTICVQSLVHALYAAAPSDAHYNTLNLRTVPARALVVLMRVPKIAKSDC